MSLFKRLFSADYRAAVAAEAAGDLQLAAERYALAGQTEAAVRVHLRRATRADGRADEIAALRDALHWAENGTPVRVRVCKLLGSALLEKARAEGIATERDRKKVAEAASMLSDGGSHREAGKAFESIDDLKGAIVAYRKGGLVDLLEDALRRESEGSGDARTVRESFADYDLAMKGGDRDAALRYLRRVVDAADDKTEYQRMFDDLESRLITGGRAELRARQGERVTVFSGDRALLGRDPLCDLVLRSGGVSRRHAEIAIRQGSFELADAGSRNGTTIGGMPLEGKVPLEGEGSFGLGSECEIHFNAAAEPARLTLSIERGLDVGTRFVAAAEGALIPITLRDLELRVYFRSGRLILQHPGDELWLGDQRLMHGDVQLIHGDTLRTAGVEFEVT